ncbi:glycosyltransferase family 4 protein [Nonlabens xiamenensis]|uniref:glycosyltransferase family 4 protein n=1 Tax=Nonlabens xiamenensis TaxID=2341043 RepID=UPI000F60C86C|nr:glycosyltransferase family 4 protein [Nonlabens xiamenensis]
MRILFLTFYFEPDLSAGSFRNTPLFKALLEKLPSDYIIDVITTVPNRYSSFKVDSDAYENYSSNSHIHRIKIPRHTNGLLGQINSFKTFYFHANKIAKGKKYDLVYASSSRLFTAFLGARIAQKNNAKLYLDIRDIFRESIVEIFSNGLTKRGLDLLLRPVESYTFNRAAHINLVSKGFASYFSKYKAQLSFFTNGIDEEFLHNLEKNTESPTSYPKIIVYAGNMGEGQGLHKIVPDMAEKLGSDYKFKIIGDGGKRQELQDQITQREIDNVIILPPVQRAELYDIYTEADYLFLHLNDYNAFERVLPSKLFEYATFPVPIIAGVAGYAEEFVKSELSNYILFAPNNVDDFMQKIKEYDYHKEMRTSFVNKYRRHHINLKMADSIKSYLNE